VPFVTGKRESVHGVTSWCAEANIWREDLLAKKQIIENEKSAYKRI